MPLSFVRVKVPSAFVMGPSWTLLGKETQSTVSKLTSVATQ